MNQENNQFNDYQQNPITSSSSNHNNNNKTKLLVIIFVCLILVGVCIFVIPNMVNKNTATNDNNNSNDIEENISNDSSNTNNKNEISDYENMLESAFKVPMKNIYINYPFSRLNEDSTWHEVEWGYTEYWHIGHEMFINFTSARKDNPTDLMDAHKIATDKFIETMSNKHLNYLTITQDKKITINNIEMYKYIGTINIGTDTISNKYAIGYSFIIDGVPCNITGYTYKAEDTDEIIKELTNTVDAMANTVRTIK